MLSSYGFRLRLSLIGDADSIATVLDALPSALPSGLSADLMANLVGSLTDLVLDRAGEPLKFTCPPNLGIIRGVGNSLAQMVSQVSSLSTAFDELAAVSGGVTFNRTAHNSMLTHIGIAERSNLVTAASRGLSQTARVATDRIRPSASALSTARRSVPASAAHAKDKLGGILIDGLDWAGRSLLVLQGFKSAAKFISGRAPKSLSGKWFVGKDLARISSSLKRTTSPLRAAAEKIDKAMPKSLGETWQATGDFLNGQRLRLSRLFRTSAKGTLKRAAAADEASEATGALEKVAGRRLALRVGLRGLGDIGVALAGLDVLRWASKAIVNWAGPRVGRLMDPKNAADAVAFTRAYKDGQGSLAGLTNKQLAGAAAAAANNLRRRTELRSEELPWDRWLDPLEDKFLLGRTNEDLDARETQALTAITTEQARRRLMPAVTGSNRPVAQRLGVAASSGHSSLPSKSSREPRSSTRRDLLPGIVSSQHQAPSGIRTRASPSSSASPHQAHVPLDCCCAPIQITTKINLDGRAIATVVSKYQAHSICGPGASHLAPDGNYGLRPVQGGYRQ